MERTHIVYTPTVEEIVRIICGKHYLEVWNGLPDLHFEPSRAGGGEMGLRSEQDGNYVWVVPQAARTLEAAPRTILVPLLEKRADGKLYATMTDLPPDIYGETLDSIVNKAKEMNLRHFFPSRKEKYDLFKIGGR